MGDVIASARRSHSLPCQNQFHHPERWKGDQYIRPPAGGVGMKNQHEYHYGQLQDGPEATRLWLPGGNQPRASLPLVIVDMGTYHSVYRGQKEEYIGGVILPGLKRSFP